MPHPTHSSCPQHPVLCDLSKNKIRNFAVFQTKEEGRVLVAERKAEGEGNGVVLKYTWVVVFSPKQEKNRSSCSKPVLLEKLCQNMVSAFGKFSILPAFPLPRLSLSVLSYRKKVLS